MLVSGDPVSRPTNLTFLRSRDTRYLLRPVQNAQRSKTGQEVNDTI